ncbi:putative baseplate assembly protein [Actinoplanes sp. NPDC026623]|uniref:putative baseplate assembly protein n=1 Tax=Actinoplanes sp. NPDC026623 TaxID=3155610 RepID=UPI0033DDD396
MNAAVRVLAELERRQAGYLPSGRRLPPDGSGAGMLTLIAHLAGLVEEALDQIPDKYLIAFLDAMGATLLPPSPARAPLVFALAAQAPADVALPAETEVAAVIAPALPLTFGAAGAPAAAEPVIFATERSISLARARLACVYSIIPALDEYADHSADLGRGFAFFDGSGRIPHHLYLGHDTLFDLKESADISLQVGVSQPRGPRQQTAAVGLRWEYLTAAGWAAFEPVIDQTHGLTVDGEVLLRKICGAALAKGVVNGVESFWIRARADRPLALPGGAGDEPLPRIDRFRVRVSLTHSGLPLDAAFNDGLRLDPSKDFQPFGAEPVPGSSFLMACDDAFKRDGTQLRIVIEPSEDSTAAITSRTLTWEYSVGEGLWQEISLGASEQFQKGDGKPREIRFARPGGWRPATIGGRSHHWLRVRLATGDYGRTRFTAGTLSTPNPPLLARITVAYAYATGPAELQHVVARNLFTLADHTEAVRWGREAFQPFQPVPDRVPAAYFGFDAPLPIGLVSLFADGGGPGAAGSSQPASPFVWEYRSPEGWSELAVLDETGGIRQPGMIQFVGQPDPVADAGPGSALYWIRARLKAATATPETLPLAGLYPNAVWATHRGAVRREIAGRSDGSAGLTLTLQHPPVLPGQTIEVQEWQGTGREWESLFRDVPDGRLRLDRDGGGRVVGVWVQWQERAHLYSSDRHDRHYTLERTGGLVRFGDGRSGMSPPPGATISASYRFGGGPRGNVGPGVLTQLHSPVPYLQTVTNPVAADGGAAAEQATTVSAALRHPLPTGDAPRPGAGIWARGPQLLRHRGRAVSAADYEWIARDASSEVAIARCSAASGPAGDGMPGWVTVAIVPWTDQPQPQPGPELLRRVHDRLSRRAPAAVAGRIRVAGPQYQPVSVIAEVVVRDTPGAAEIEEGLRRALVAFLHPLTGGLDRAGWGFGEPVRLSTVAAVVEGAAGVDFATVLQLSTGGAVHGESVPIPADRLPVSGRHLLKLRLGG